ncbi:CFEM domain-containing protein [Purpureocillium lilacinum]|uniref:CFEM domain-containing protein n=1 Tax=Purpureocillium lilacinum TaxID=33203 RepID=A0A179GQ76_PURLI|nr:CFEM domain-containing protein [Purpureocillium lilacinum]KAK4088609.1 hypothetical protein Purlil1_7160 [Purpureocillium lilacinum]OAQ79648.1 CFEM domain-containing protein [Purpureocillium lilacinum]OAQ88952.1 CFEM domain-containing protein [Purpureocillium lilacinum]GJN73946.1 hypothetical protein PLICBS_008030 [Purpureocillium lilacinum]GJN84460.1 hypothetical protein PLIIFM63780_008017 [Purpureocillium lilacinum]
MKYTAVLSLALATLAAAQSRSDLPSCALPCLDDAVKESSSCKTDDFACICKNFDKIQGAATGCILKDCGQDVALNKVLPATQELCKKALAGGSGSSAGSSAAQTDAPATSEESSNTVAPTATVAPTTSAAQPTEPPSTTTAANPPSVTAGAAAVGPAMGLAVLALGVFAL